MQMILVVVVLILVVPYIGRINSADIPNCEYDDTVNITGSPVLHNGTYDYEGLLIPPELTGTYDYEVLYNGKQRTVPEHIRGCVCKLKSCVKFCCGTDEELGPDGIACIANNNYYDPHVNITYNNGIEVSSNVLDKRRFAVQKGNPCGKELYALEPGLYEEDHWLLYENGTLLRLYDGAYLRRRDYCFAPYYDNFSNTIILTPNNCPHMQDVPLIQKVYALTMSISIPFFIVTMLVYLIIPQLRNLNTKCFVCYLIALSLGYTLMVVISMADVSSHPTTCSFIGFGGQYCLTCAFFWLSVISFDLWYSFRPNSGQRNVFLAYSLYAWLGPLALTLLTILAQMSNMDEKFKPGIGPQNCWFRPDDWSAMIYFYGPTALLIVFNIVMFSLTAWKIYKTTRATSKMLASENTTRSRAQRNNYVLFLQLFMLMGLSWILEVISYLAGQQSSVIFYISDFYNASQGIIIFVIVVLKRKVFSLLKKKFGFGGRKYSEGTTTFSLRGASKSISKM